MKFSQETSALTKRVTRYGPDGLWIGSDSYQSSVLVTATAVHPWSATTVNALTTAQLDEVLALKPELILLATGAKQAFPSPALLYHVLGRRIGIEVMDLGGAARTYNVLVGDERPVVLAALLG